MQLIDGMPALVNDGVERADQIVLIVVCRDADVFVVEFQRKRVQRFTEPAVAPVDAHHFHDAVGQSALSIRWIEAEQEIIPDFCMFAADGFNQRYDVRPKLCKEAVQHAAGHPGFVFVQQNVIWRFFRIRKRSKPFFCCNQFLQIRGK